MNLISNHKKPKHTFQVNDNQQEPIAFLRRGDLCPKCGQGHMDYDGLLNLSCTNCDYTKPDGCGFT